ncbi:unnamed protein product [Ostreobium quekettii]|uniref:RCC1-like domain-containing protein n=1 Tax=Ostreobium quekettii TaxID=121088 RepID=A0A8S1IM76_9CHLO|nr:unnamed protein product [Ostreobium quekettii]|eukprot:evm.model.scf_311.1 EVM.evm.TU.scf_311.1   scf_311:5164-11707(+)
METKKPSDFDDEDQGSKRRILPPRHARQVSSAKTHGILTSQKTHSILMDNKKRRADGSTDKSLSSDKQKKRRVQSKNSRKRQKVAPLSQELSQPSQTSKRRKVPVSGVIADGTTDAKLVEVIEATAKLELVEGDIFVLGSNEMGQLGLGDDIPEVARPRILSLPGEVKVRMVACGSMHTVALAADNTLFSWGINDDGALGRPTEDSNIWSADEKEGCIAENLPGQMVMTDANMRIKSVNAGGSHTLVLANGGRVLGCGSFRNNAGPFGFSPGVLNQRTLTTVVEASVQKISSGESHCLALTGSGKVLTWGVGDLGCLARGGEQLVPAPAQMARGPLSHVQNVFACQEASFAVLPGGKVYGWGLNNQGQLGLPPCDSVERATEIKALSSLGGIKDAAGGQHHTLVLSCEGKVYSFGTPTNGVLGRLGEDGKDLNISGIDPAPLPVPTPVHEGDGEAGGLPPGFRVSAVLACQTVSQCIVEGQGVYVWGASMSQQLGLGLETEEIALPTKMPETKKRQGRPTLGGAIGALHAAFVFGSRE